MENPIASIDRPSLKGNSHCKENLAAHHRTLGACRITEYVEVFYKRQRRQARLGYLSPSTYARKYYEERQAVNIIGVNY